MAFPASPPPSFDDPAAIREHDWQAFLAVTQLENHWDRAGWAPDRRSYHWFVTFDDEPALHDLARRCQQYLDLAHLDPVTAGGLHLTLGRIAFTDQIDRHQATAVAKRARQRCADVPPFDVEVGPLAGSTGAVRFTVAPWREVTELHRELMAATHDVLGALAVADTESFRPHVTIAYVNSVIDPREVQRQVQQARQLSPVRTRVPAAHLVQLRRDDQAYCHEVIESVPLGGPDSIGDAAPESRPR
jgi:2'-5' RNA ligase